MKNTNPSWIGLLNQTLGRVKARYIESNRIQDNRLNGITTTQASTLIVLSRFFDPIKFC